MRGSMQTKYSYPLKFNSWGEIQLAVEVTLKKIAELQKNLNIEQGHLRALGEAKPLKKVNQ